MARPPPHSMRWYLWINGWMDGWMDGGGWCDYLSLSLSICVCVCLCVQVEMLKSVSARKPEDEPELILNLKVAQLSSAPHTTSAHTPPAAIACLFVCPSIYPSIYPCDSWSTRTVWRCCGVGWTRSSPGSSKWSTNTSPSRPTCHVRHPADIHTLTHIWSVCLSVCVCLCVSGVYGQTPLDVSTAWVIKAHDFWEVCEELNLLVGT